MIVFEISSRLLFLLVAFLTNFVQCSIFGDSCGTLNPPRNAVVTSCTRGAKVGSECTVRCDYGFRPEQGTRFCSCNPFCIWEGPNPTCQVRECNGPDNDEGEVTIVDEWRGGFAALIEFRSVPLILLEGWSITLAFDKQLGRNAQLISWSSQSTAVSEDGNSFTLSSPRYNNRAPFLNRDGMFRSLFVIMNVDGKMPSRGYVGMYDRRITDTTCYRPSQPLSVMQKLPPFAATRTPPASPPRAATRASTTTSTTIPTAAMTTTTIAVTTTTPTPEPSTVSERQSINNQSRVIDTSSNIDANTEDHALTNSTTAANTNIFSSLSVTSATVNAVTSSAPSAVAGIALTQRHRMEIDGIRCIFQRGESIYRTQKAWNDRGVIKFSGNAVVFNPWPISNWMIVVIFQTPISAVRVWNTEVIGNESEGILWKFGARDFNVQLHAGKLDMRFVASMDSLRIAPESNPTGEVYFCASEYEQGEPIRMPNDDGSFPEPGPPLATPSVALPISPTTMRPANLPSDSSNVEIRRPANARIPNGPATGTPEDSERCRSSSPMGQRPKRSRQSRLMVAPASDGTEYDYNEVLAKSILFYEAQRSGYLPPRFKLVRWRGNAMMKDGCSIGVDLSGGWFDAGDYCKFTFPMAAAVTNLAWGGIEFRSAYKDAATLTRFLGSVKWPVKYLMKAHLAPNELVVLVGDVRADHSNWGRPEDWNVPRPVYKITNDHPGTEVAAETAAALASSFLLLRRTRRAIARDALSHARTLYQFAKSHRGNYQDSVPQIKDFYSSTSGYNDELIWAATWLYKATGEQEYLDDAQQLYRRVGGPASEYSWDNKMVGAQVLLANLTGAETYRSAVVHFMNAVMRFPTKTPSGMMWLRRHGPNRYAANAAMIAILACQLQPPLPGRELYLQWAKKQIHLLLGDAGRSYVIGFGNNYPERAHHRSSSCPPPPAPCNWSTLTGRQANHFVLYGALVGGPSRTGVYDDDRQNYAQSEVALDYNAGFQTAVAGLKYHAMQTRSQPTEQPRT